MEDSCGNYQFSSIILATLFTINVKLTFIYKCTITLNIDSLYEPRSWADEASLNASPEKQPAVAASPANPNPKFVGDATLPKKAKEDESMSATGTKTKVSRNNVFCIAEYRQACTSEPSRTRHIDQDRIHQMHAQQQAKREPKK